MPRRRLWIPAAIAAVALISLPLPFAPVYDPWGWLVWGREVGSLDLDTSAGPSWKPLPVIFTTVFSVADGAAPDLWLLVARLGWLASPVLAALVAWRLAPRRPEWAPTVAAGTAALAVLLISDSFTSWTRQFTGGLSEPLLVALVLGAVDRWICGRHGQALALGASAALLRPEAWPFLALYGVWLWRDRAVSRRVLVGAAVAVPALWLVPDLAGSGDALTGAGRARSATGEPLGEGLESLGRSFDLVLWPLWAAAVFAVFVARRRAERAVPVIGAVAGAWVAIVAVMAAAGYAGLPRFAAPAGALACVLGAVGIAELAGEVHRSRRLASRLRAVGLGALVGGPRYRRAVAAALALGIAAVAMVAQGAVRAGEIPGEVERAVDFNEDVDDLEALVAGPAAGCLPVWIADLYFQTALAWQLELPIASVGVRFASAPPRGTFVVGARSPARARVAAVAKGEAVGRSGGWTAYRIGCER